MIFRACSIFSSVSVETVEKSQSWLIKPDEHEKNALALYMLMLLSLGTRAQNYVAPPPLLPNPAHSSTNYQTNPPVYAPEVYNNNLGNTTTLNQGPKTHIVQKGESLYRISRMYNVSVENIKAWNYLNSDLIGAGTSLSIGTAAPYAANGVPAQYNQLSSRAVPAWLSGVQNHTVLQGESLASIARYYGFTEERLRVMNNLGAQDPIQPGYILKVNPCADGYQSQGNNPPASYEQGNYNSTTNNSGEALNYNSPVPKYYPPQDRFANSNNFNNSASNNSTYNPNANVPNNYDYNNPSTTNTQGNYTYRREDQYDPNQANSSAVPSSYEYAARASTTVPANPAATNSSLIIENGRKVHIVGGYDTLETIADLYRLSSDRIRALNNMGAYDVVWPNQKLYLE